MIIEDVGLERFTETTITDLAILLQESEKIRKDGYSESDGEAIVGTRGIAAPIFSFSGRIVASLGASVPRLRGEGSPRQQLISLLTDAARRITREITAQETRRG